MQVNSIGSSNYSNTFTGGINSTLYKKIVPDNKYQADIFKKLDDVSRTNKIRLFFLMLYIMQKKRLQNLF